MRRYLILGLAGVVLLFAALVWLGGRWLESSGGRALLERELERRSGLPVRLRGDFDLMLYPAIGVSGGGLTVGGAADEDAPFSSREYAVALAPGPLLHGEYRIEWIRLDGGTLVPARFGASTRPEAGGTVAELRLPDVRELALRDFSIRFGEDADRPFRIGALIIQDFAEQRPTRFELDLNDAGSITGDFLWGGPERTLRLSGLHWDSPGGTLQGGGCVVFAEPLAVNLALSAESLDFDTLQAVFDFDSGGGADGSGETPGLNIRLEAGELRSGGLVARGVSITVGGEPSCAGGT